MSFISAGRKEIVDGLFVVVEEVGCEVDDDVFETQEQAMERAAARDAQYGSMRHRVYQLLKVPT